MNEVSTITRRRFIKVLLATGGTLGVAFLTRFATASPGADLTTLVAGEAPGNYPVGSCTALGSGRVWLCRDQQGFFALEARCTHLGCRVQWDVESEMFVCPCHGSHYTRGGAVLRGPAAKPLRAVAVRLGRNGRVEVDLRRGVSEKARLVA